MTEIIRNNKKMVLVRVNGHIFKIPNEDLQKQLTFMEQVVPMVKNKFSFAQFFEPIPQLES